MHGWPGPAGGVELVGRESMGNPIKVESKRAVHKVKNAERDEGREKKGP
jgi:hypothetical protein